MAVILNEIDVLLQAAVVRVYSVNLPSNILVGYSVITGTKPVENADVTGDNTAAAIAGQGALATESTISTALIDAGAVTAAETTIAAINSTTGNLNTDTVDTAQVVADAITEAEINVASLSLISADLGTVTSGDLNTSGYVRSSGAVTDTLGETSIYGNQSNTASIGVAGESGTTAGDIGVLGGATSSDTYGVQGQSIAKTNGVGVRGYATGATGIAVEAVAATGAVALSLDGAMETNNSTLVANLNSDLLDGKEAADFHLKTSTSISIPAIGTGDGGQVVLEADGTAYNVTVATSGTTTTTTLWTVGWNSTNKVEVDDVGDMTILGTLGENSDRRIKTDIELIGEALSKVKAINGVTYKRTDTGSDKRQVGLIADEVESVLPEAVSIGKDKDKIKSLAYGNLVGLLVEAIKELSDKVERLESKNA